MCYISWKSSAQNIRNTSFEPPTAPRPLSFSPPSAHFCCPLARTRIISLLRLGGDLWLGLSVFGWWLLSSHTQLCPLLLLSHGHSRMFHHCRPRSLVGFRLRSVVKTLPSEGAALFIMLYLFIHSHSIYLYMWKKENQMMCSGLFYLIALFYHLFELYQMRPINGLLHV